MKTKLSLFVLSVSLFLFSCGYEALNTPPEKGVESQNNQDHLIMSALFVQLSAEYKAQCYQAFNTAKRRLSEKINENSTQLQAVVLDLDETVLDNSPYAGFQIESGLPYAPNSWKEWTAQAAAETVPGAADFLHFADSLGVTLFYVSNRRVDELQSTQQNMANLNLPQIADSNFLLREKESDKENRRQKIINQGYDILLFCGDQLGDFESVWDQHDNNARSKTLKEKKHLLGDSYIILPNPIYGIWERNLFKDSNYSAREKMQIRKKTIRAFQPVNQKENE